MDRRLIHIKTHVFLEIFKMYALNDCQMELSYKKKCSEKLLQMSFFLMMRKLISCLDLCLKLLYAIYTTKYCKSYFFKYEYLVAYCHFFLN